MAGTRQVAVNSWRNGGRDNGIGSYKSCHCQDTGMLDESERLAASLPDELMEVIMPVQQLLEQVCQSQSELLLHRIASSKDDCHEGTFSRSHRQTRSGCV